MISDVDLVAIHLKGSPTQGAAITRERGEQWLKERARGARTIERWELLPVPACACCGEPAWPNGRCTKHQGRNPCAIDGCKRTKAAPDDGRLSNDQWLCSEHWRRFVPPRGMRRAAYHEFFRQAKKYGWGWKGPDGKSPRLDWRFHRFWDALVKQARRRAAEGHIDQREIERIFGWGEGAG